MSKQLIVLAMLLAAACASGAQDEPEGLTAGPQGPGQPVSCIVTVSNPWSGNPQIEVAYHGPGSKSWNDVDAAGGWSFSGNAYGSENYLSWSGKWWYWLGPLQAQAAGGAGCHP